MEYEGEPQREYDEEPRGYDDHRARSRSPGMGNGDSHRDRSASPRNRDRDGDSRGPPPSAPPEDEEEARNAGSNLFVTGIHPRLTEEDITSLFGKYGDVEKCDIMRDPHTKESRGFGFVSMANTDAADAAKEGLQGEVHEGRTLSIEKARRNKPRQPTPGRYFGPPKNDRRPPPRGGGRYNDRFDDRRGYGRRDDYRERGYGGPRRYDDRGYGRRYDDRPPPDRGYGSDRYGGRSAGGGGGGGGRDYYERRDYGSRGGYDDAGGDRYGDRR